MVSWASGNSFCLSVPLQKLRKENDGLLRHLSQAREFSPFSVVSQAQAPIPAPEVGGLLFGNPYCGEITWHSVWNHKYMAVKVSANYPPSQIECCKKDIISSTSVQLYMCADDLAAVKCCQVLRVDLSDQLSVHFLPRETTISWFIQLWDS